MELKGTFGKMRVIAIAIIFAILPGTLKAQTPLASPTFAKVAIGDGITRITLRAVTARLSYSSTAL